MVDQGGFRGLPRLKAGGCECVCVCVWKRGSGVQGKASIDIGGRNEENNGFRLQGSGSMVEGFGFRVFGCIYTIFKPFNNPVEAKRL